ncbi:MAG TPA: TetR family transcriptional regulator [Tessaracoccus flavescens]|uniref:TetR family transcriptional regulator n=1 Tax=Tessaracoccus flavescens TaxID=399497 RepID=A0A921EMI9_9ACTN|nr:TetR family transcriptional regulator [Tessaracoccus flavescens]
MTDDRTTKARLRDAAIALVAEGGLPAATARAVAERADASLGLIRHHFGSMAKLIEACDHHIAARIREGKERAIAAGGGFDALSAVRATGSDHVMGYLAMRLGEDSPGISALVDLIIADAREYIEAGVEAGMLLESKDESARAAMVSIFALGSLVLHRHLSRHLDVDVRSAQLSDQPGFPRYLLVQMEIFSSMLHPHVLDQYSSLIESLKEGSHD